MKKAEIQFNHESFELDFADFIDISIGIRKADNVNAFFLPNPAFETVKAGDFIGDVNQGGSCNVENIAISPHGNGTHTECLGHISKEKHLLDDCLQEYHFLASLITVNLTENSTHKWLSEESLHNALSKINGEFEALIVRTTPNPAYKKNCVYSGKQPPYITENGMKLIKKTGINHLLVDLPSLDHEENPDLPAHHAFFEYPENPKTENTVTEMVYIPDNVADGIYLLNLQVISLESDASPCKPILYHLTKK